LCGRPGYRRQNEQGYYQYIFHQGTSNFRAVARSSVQDETGAEHELDDVDGSEFASKPENKSRVC
jgi:hypothetical protein